MALYKEFTVVCLQIWFGETLLQTTVWLLEAIDEMPKWPAPEERELLEFLWQVTVESTAIWKLKLPASAQHWKHHFQITVNKNKNKKATEGSFTSWGLWYLILSTQWALLSSWNKPLGMSSRDSLDWVNWRVETHLNYRQHRSLGCEKELSTRLHLCCFLTVDAMWSAAWYLLCHFCCDGPYTQTVSQYKPFVS